MRWDGFSAVRDAEEKEYAVSKTSDILSQKLLWILLLLTEVWIWAQNYEILFHKRFFFFFFFPKYLREEVSE